MQLTDRSLNLPETLNVKVSKPDFHSSVLLVLVHLSSYHNYIDQIHQQKLIRCLMMCTNTAGSRTSNSLKHCISALTICTMEMKDAMVKMLPDVLLNLSQKSATVHIAIPVLEFLSSKCNKIINPLGKVLNTNFVVNHSINKHFNSSYWIRDSVFVKPIKNLPNSVEEFVIYCSESN